VSAAPVLVIGGLALGTATGQIAFLAGWVLFGPLAAGIWSAAGQIAGRRAFRVRDLPRRVRTEWIAGLLFFLVDGGLGWLLVANVRFYFTSTAGILGRPLPTLAEGMRVGHLVAFVWLAPLVLWALAQLYALPLLVAERRGIGAALRRAALLVVDNIGFPLALAAVVVVLSGILLLTGVGALVLLPGVVAVLTTNAVRALLSKYGHP